MACGRDVSAAIARSLGKKIVLNGEPFDVIGVMPATFRGVFTERTEVWAPLVFKPEQFGENRRTNEFLAAVGRLKSGVGHRAGDAGCHGVRREPQARL